MTFDISDVKIPIKPGCYIFKNNKGTIIYIGKAKVLKKRVQQYFSKKHDSAKTAQLVTEIRDVEFFVTKNEVEALLLEAQLIQRHQPKFNIDLKGGRRYAWILVTDDEFPRIMTARHKKKKGTYFGPFTSGQTRHNLIQTLQSIFFIRTCSKLPKKACLRYHIGLCKAPCAGHQSKKDYQEGIERAVQYLKGNNAELVKQLRLEMKQATQNQEYEIALQRRDQIKALESLHTKQVIESENEYEEDVIDYIKDNDNIKVIVLNIRKGIMRDKETFSIPYTDTFLEEFIKRYYEQPDQIPRRINIPTKLTDPSIIAYLEKQSGHKVTLNVPQRGARLHMMQLARQNLEVGYEDYELTMKELSEKLRLNADCHTIECFDISHHGGSQTVGSMVRFTDGKPDKSNYRRFKVKTVDGIDDFRAMAEVVRRRYTRLKLEAQEANVKPDYPDLVIIDGGEQQLKFAIVELIKLNVRIPIIGLAKKYEEIYFPSRPRPIKFDKKSRMMKLLINCRNEAHRFAIKYHRLRKQRQISNPES